MFLKAGYNPEQERTGIRAVLMRTNWPWVGRRSVLIRFACGDLAWRGAGGYSWGTEEDLRIRSLIEGPLPSPWWSPFHRWHCRLDTGEECGKPPPEMLSSSPYFSPCSSAGTGGVTAPPLPLAGTDSP